MIRPIVGRKVKNTRCKPRAQGTRLVEPAALPIYDAAVAYVHCVDGGERYLMHRARLRLPFESTQENSRSKSLVALVALSNSLFSSRICASNCLWVSGSCSWSHALS